MIIIPSNVLGSPSDPFFNDTVLLLKTTNVNGATNSAFRDDSPNNFVPTRTGDVTQGTLSPYVGTVGDEVPVVGGGAYFDGTGDYLTVNNAALAPGSGDFTLECWINIAAPSDSPIMESRSANFATTGFTLTALNSTVIRIFTSSAILSATVPNYAGLWTHVAVVKSVGTTTLYVNGVPGGTTTSLVNLTDTELIVGGGRYGGTTQITHSFSGRISNFRIVKGSAVYTAAFTPPAAPLTAIVNTSLLTCQSPTSITDASTNAFTITRTGDVRPDSLTPFGYGSVYLDGTGDYLTLPANAGFTFGTGDFTVECHVYIAAPGATANGIFQQGTSLFPATVANTVALGTVNASSVWQIYAANDQRNSTEKFALNRWYHCAVVRASGTTKLYVDGVAVITQADTTNYTGTFFGIGQIYGGYPHNGYIANFRVVKGTAVYTANFTPPTAPLTAITNTQLLTCQEPGPIVDRSTNAFAITRVGDARATRETPFAPRPSNRGWSTYLDGTTAVVFPANAIYAPGTGNFTVEGWINPSTWGSAWAMVHVAQNGGVYVGSIGSEFVIRSAGQGNILTTATLPTLNTWTHVVAVRSGTTLSLFLNGVRVATMTSAFDFVGTGPLIIGSGSGATTTGNISNVRFVKGVAVYDPTQATLAVPTSPLTNVSGTSLLTMQDNRHLDRSSYGVTPTLTGTPAVTRFSPFPVVNTVTTNLASTGSVVFDGTGDYLSGSSSPSGQVFGFGTADYTVEAWINPGSGATASQIIAGGNAGCFALRLGRAYGGSGILNGLQITVSQQGDGDYCDFTFTPGRWYHVAVTRQSSTIRFFVDGALITNAAPSTGSRNWTAETSWRAGAAITGDEPYRGNISNLRVVKGTAVYTAAFTPSTSPLTAITGTSLLTAQDSLTVTDASTNNLTITRAGDAKASEVSPFKRSTALYGGSGYFDGAGDYLTLPNHTSLQFGTGDFTCEGWFLREDANTGRTLFSIGDYGGGLMFRTDYFSFVNVAFNPNASLPVGQWFHAAVTRASGTLRVFVNGTAISTTTNTANHTSASSTVGTAVHSPTTEVWKGGIANFRVVKGTAVYTAPFVPPAAPVTAITGTSLLLNFDNAGIHDATAANTLAAVGDAKTSTAVTLFGGSTMYFDGTGDFLRFPLTDALRMGAGNYTIECWIRPNVASAGTIYCDRTSGDFSGWLLIILSGKVSLAVPSGGGYQILTLGTDGGSVPVGAWSHVAVSRESGTWRVYINGVFQFSKTFAGSVTQNAGPVLIGKDAGGAQPDFNGSISDLRITRAARYTANFTPPSSELPARAPS